MKRLKDWIHPAIDLAIMGFSVYMMVWAIFRW